MTAATGWNFGANGCLTQGLGAWGDQPHDRRLHSVCIVTNAATQLSDSITYTIY